jgi:Fe(3+) dicitrate transport protein
VLYPLSQITLPRMLKLAQLLILVVLTHNHVATAQNRVPTHTSSLPDSIRKISMPQVDVIGSIDRLSRIPGSAYIIQKADIERISAVSGNEVIRKVAGLHVVDEEGVGLRVNIGIRGLDPDRSRTVLMLEDGVPVALAPYGEPEMYYTPSIDRMSGLEILKGSGSILYGPQTFGGVINYQTANPPATPSFNALVRGGQGGFFTGRFSYGTTAGNTGFVASYLRKQGNNVGLIDYGIHDINAKIKMVFGSRSVVGVKLGLYDEASNATYVGLTQPMYDSGLYDFAQLAPDDNLAIRRYSGSVNHHYFFTDNLQLKTTAFAYTTTRDWSRQDFTYSPSQNATYVRTVGDTGIPGGAIYFLDRTGNRNRTFEVYGFEPRLSANFDAGNIRNELDAGLRYLFERAIEQRIDGNTSRPTSGTLREDEIRTGRAFSAYVQNRVYLTDRVTITPGVRLENFQYERDILRLNNANVAVVSNDHLTEIIPGAGFNMAFSSGSSLFAGVHRGFGPPRVKDAISNGGESEQLDAELSWNYEAGARFATPIGLNAEITLYYMDFSNQIIPVSESSGGLGQPGASGLINGGETAHRGVELTISGNLGEMTSTKLGLNFSMSATVSDATFSNDRFVAKNGGTVNIRGNTLPYAPGIMLNSTVEWIDERKFSIGISGTYVGRQYGDVLNTIEGSLDGRNGEIPTWHTFDINTSVPILFAKGLRFNASVKNIFDSRHIVNRRPQGIRVGLPRFFTAGFELSI